MADTFNFTAIEGGNTFDFTAGAGLISTVEFTGSVNQKGETGDAGPAATLTIGTTTTLAPGQPATATNSGTTSAAVLNLGIPAGVGAVTGGAIGQVLKKNSNTNYDASYATLVKADVGLANVDNTSDAAKNSAAVALTNKDLTTGNTYPTFNQNTTGNAATVTTNANLTGDVTSVGNATSIAAGVVVNADINASAAIDTTKLANGSVSNAEFQYLDGVTSAIQTQLNSKQGTLTLTTTGTSGAATLVSNTLNIPQYNGGGGGGTGDVVGPASATDNAVARYDTTTGKLIQDSLVSINDSGRLTAPTMITGAGTPVTLSISGVNAAPANQTMGMAVADAASSNVRFTNASNAGPAYLMAKSRSNTINTNTILLNGDIMGNIFFNGADGTDYQNAAIIRGVVDGTPGTGVMPGKIEFYTSPAGSSTPALRLTINSTGNLVIPDSATAGNLSVGTTNGTMIGLTASEKIGLWGATPVVQQTPTTELFTALKALGIFNTSSTATPITTSGAVVLSGSMRWGVTVHSASITLNMGYPYFQNGNATSGAINLTLATTTTIGFTWCFTKTDASANAVTLIGTINGQTNYVLAKQYDSVILKTTSTSGAYEIVGGVSANLTAGTNVSITGTGIPSNPYVISASGGAGSGIIRSVVVTTTGYTTGSTASTDYVYLIAGAHAGTLPTATGNSNRYTFKNNHTAAVTVTAAGSDLIDGTASISINPGDSVDLISNNTNAWSVI